MGVIELNAETILFFEGGYLKVLKEEDITEEYVSGLNNPKVNRYLEVRHSKQSYESVKYFITQNLNSKNSILFGIWGDQKKNFLGTVRIHGISDKLSTSHIGICIFDELSWGFGFGKKSVMSVTSWALKIKKIKQVEAGVYIDNLASQKIFLSAGYKWKCNLIDKYPNSVIKVYVASAD